MKEWHRAQGLSLKAIINEFAVSIQGGNNLQQTFCNEEDGRDNAAGAHNKMWGNQPNTFSILSINR
jgi:hypothetical protein